jgi:hypothetical protein
MDLIEHRVQVSPHIEICMKIPTVISAADFAEITKLTESLVNNAMHMPALRIAEPKVCIEHRAKPKSKRKMSSFSKKMELYIRDLDQSGLKPKGIMLKLNDRFRRAFTSKQVNSKIYNMRRKGYLAKKS